MTKMTIFSEYCVYANSVQQCVQVVYIGMVKDVCEGVHLACVCHRGMNLLDCVSQVQAVPGVSGLRTGSSPVRHQFVTSMHLLGGNLEHACNMPEKRAVLTARLTFARTRNPVAPY